MSASSSSSADIVASCKAMMSNPDNIKTLVRGDKAERQELLARHNLQGVDPQELRAALMSSVKGETNASDENLRWMIDAAAAWIVD